MANERISMPSLSDIYADDGDVDREVFKKIRLSKSFVYTLMAIFQTCAKEKRNAFPFRAIRRLCPFERDAIYKHLEWLQEVKLLVHVTGAKEPYSLLGEDFDQVMRNAKLGEAETGKGYLFTMKNLIQLKESFEIFEQKDKPRGESQ